MRKDGETFLQFVFNQKKARRAINFIERFCYLSEGQFAGKPIKLRPFQQTMISELFGWEDPATGLRRYRKAFWFFPRKNGKSTLIAGIALFMLVADGENGAQVILASNSKDQSGVVFKPAAAMVQQSPSLKEECDVRKSVKRILHPSTNSFLTVIPAEAKTVLGLNISCLIYDEIAAAPDRDLYDALTTSSGTRTQPLQLFITTAGKDQDSIGYELYTYAKNVLANPESDPTFYPVIYELPAKEDWSKEENWYKCNPALGDFKLIADVRAEFTEALSSTTSQGKFKMFSLNQWVQAADSWLDVEKWKLCIDPAFDESVLNALPCYMGLDFSKTTDLTALVALWKLPDGRWYVKPLFFLPGDDLRARVLKDHVPYDAWTQDHFVTLTPGPVIDYEFVRKQLEDFKKQNNVLAIGYDSWGAKQFAQELEKEGYPMIIVRQGHESLGSPSKEFESLIISKKILHDNNPCLTWQIGNVVTRLDANNNIVPDKKHSNHRIDGVQASIMALHCAMKLGNQPVKKAAELRIHVLG